MRTGGLHKKNVYKKSLKDNPLFSVITVVYNGEKHIRQTIESVLDQNYNNIEYIIVDGDSTDSTIDIIKEYDTDIDYWISEKDSGIYNAMNKGIDVCSGDYISFINADDWYEPDIFKKLKEIAIEMPDYILGDVVMLNETDEYLSTFKVDVSVYKRSMPFGHPALFLKKDILKHLKFNETYKIVADYDLCIQLIEKNYTYKYFPDNISNFRMGGVSNTLNITDEIFQIHKNYFGFVHAIYWYLVRMDNPIVLVMLKLLSTPINFLRTIRK
jgi:glycosyltransferase involved in cell wall biosynthesis